MRYGFGHGFGLLGVFSFIFQLVIIVAVVFLIVYAIRTLTRREGGSQRRYDADANAGTTAMETNKAEVQKFESAHQILAERFAKGEITAEEFREMREELEK